MKLAKYGYTLPLYMNTETGEVLTFSEALDQFLEEYWDDECHPDDLFELLYVLTGDSEPAKFYVVERKRVH